MCPYSWQLWAPTASLAEFYVNKLRTSQKEMERAIDISLRDKVTHVETRRRTKVTDIVEQVTWMK